MKSWEKKKKNLNRTKYPSPHSIKGFVKSPWFINSTMVFTAAREAEGILSSNPILYIFVSNDTCWPERRIGYE